MQIQTFGFFEKQDTFCCWKLLLGYTVHKQFCSGLFSSLVFTNRSCTLNLMLCWMAWSVLCPLKWLSCFHFSFLWGILWKFLSEVFSHLEDLKLIFSFVSGKNVYMSNSNLHFRINLSQNKHLKIARQSKWWITKLAWFECLDWYFRNFFVFSFSKNSHFINHNVPCYFLPSYSISPLQVKNNYRTHKKKE